MICGSCKDDHETVAQVKLCYHRKGQAVPEQQKAAPGDPGFQNARGSREDRRRGLMRQIKALGAKVDEGPYAIHNGPKAANNISFYQVDKPETGKWAGRTFVNRRLSDNEQRLSLDEQVRILAAIAADPQGASLLYGQTIGECPECGRSLTNEDSRRRGIGPVCARKRGYMDVA